MLDMIKFCCIKSAVLRKKAIIAFQYFLFMMFMPNDSKPFQKWDLNTVFYFTDKLGLASAMLLIVPNYKENIVI